MSNFWGCFFHVFRENFFFQFFFENIVATTMKSCLISLLRKKYFFLPLKTWKNTLKSCSLNQNQPKSHFLFHKNVSLRDYNDFDSKCVWIFIFWRISVLIRSANDQSFLKQFLISQSDKIIFEVAFFLIFRLPQASENFLVKLILRKYWNWCFGQFYQSRIEVFLNHSASFLSQLVIILSQYL